MKLEELQANVVFRGIVPDALAIVVTVQWFGSEALELTYKLASGKVANELLYRRDNAQMAGRGVDAVTLIPYMLESFIDRNRGFRFVRKTHEESSKL